MWKKKKEDREAEGGVRISDAISSSPDALPFAHSATGGARRQIAFTAALFFLLFAAMSAYFYSYAVKNRRVLFDNDYNSRDQLLETHNLRGRIYGLDLDKDGMEALAGGGSGQDVGDGAGAGDGSVVNIGELGDLQGGSPYVVLATSDREEAGAAAFAAGRTLSDGAQGPYSTRYYPYGEDFCHAVGYSILGGSGIEEYMKYELLHSDIPFSEKLAYDRAGLRYPGNDVYTTLDVPLQEMVCRVLGQKEWEYGSDGWGQDGQQGLRGAVIVTQPSTGRILAMVSRPGFDPNEIGRQWEYLRSGGAGNAPLFNRATQGLYAPGSTFKIVDAIELLEEDPDAMDTFSFDCTDGTYTYDGETIHCFQNENGYYEVHHSQDLAAAFAHSCNSAFSEIVTQELDTDRFRRTIRKLLFGGPLPYDLPYSQSSCRQMLDEKTISSHNLMQVAIGQGATLASPLHMNLLAMAVANGGILMRPYLVEEVRAADTPEGGKGEVLQAYGPRQAATLMDQSTARKVRTLMRGVADIRYDREGSEVWGTASEFAGTRSYIAFGKTGTAEFGTDEDSHAWFTGFAVDAEKGEDGEADLCITVLVENGGAGSDRAVPIAKAILDAWYGE